MAKAKTLNRHVPASVINGLADVTEQVTVALETLGRIIPEAERLRTTVEVLAADYAEEDSDRFDDWVELTGLRDLTDVLLAVGGLAGEFTGCLGDRLSGAQRVELAEMVRERITERRSVAPPVPAAVARLVENIDRLEASMVELVRRTDR